MIPLDSRRCNELQDAYGLATKILALLEQLQSDPRPNASWKDEPWYSLWPALCRQGEVFTASYAAVPWIISILRDAKPAVAMDLFLLPVSIELARVNGRGPDI
jgi:hypothetical protein